MIEAWGQGIERMMDTCMAAGLRKPRIRYEETGLWGEFRFSESILETPVKTPVKTPDMICAYLKENPDATLAETAAAAGKSLRAIERASAKLVREGRLRYTGTKKGGRWEVL